MQLHGPDTAAPHVSLLARILPFVSGILIAYGALGVAVNLRLLDLLVEGVVGWIGGRVGWDVPFHASFLSPLEAHYDGRPWLAWAAWLVGVALLSARFLGRRADHVVVGRAASEVASAKPVWARWLPVVVLLALLVVGGVGRMVELWPQDYGLSRAPYDDEGVYAGSSQLFLQGIIPYRDYFFAHPPVAAFAYAPAMAYHFTEWGSPTSFMMARYLSVFYSLITLALLFGIGYKLAGIWGGSIAGGLWALDGRVVEINRKIMLEGPLVLLSCAAVFAYLLVRPRLAGGYAVEPGEPRKWYSAFRGTRFAFFLVGVLATLSALTKIAGLACLLSIVADMVWLWIENRRAKSADGAIGTPLARTAFVSLVIGAIAAFVVVVGPFLVLAPSQFLRDVLFFQFLRPSDGVVDSPARVADLTATLANALTPMLAALGFVVLSLWVYTRSDRSLGPWRIGILWMFFSLLLFTYSRSFYQHYYIQLAAPLCLLAAGVSLAPDLVRHWTRTRSAAGAKDERSAIIMRFAPVALLALICVPLVVIQWTGMTTRKCPHCEDPIFGIVSRYVTDAVPPGSAVLSSDEQFNILAARPPSHSPTTGYLIDSYGFMISLGLNLDTRDWGDLISSALHGDHGNDPYAVMQSARPQADFLERAAIAPLIVIHERGFVRLSPVTQAAIDATYKVAEQQSRYTIYRGTAPTSPNSP